MLVPSGGLAGTLDPTSKTQNGVFEDQLGLSFWQNGHTFQVYQYFVTTIPGTPWIGVPTPVRTDTGDIMVFSIVLSALNGVWNVSINGDAGMWNPDGSPRLPLCPITH